MDFQLHVFITVVEKKNFSRAAETLHMSQSAVSIQIKTLESKYRVKLLERTNKYVRLTRAGEILYFHAKEILNHYSKLNKLIEDTYHTANGPILIGSGFTYGEYVLPKILSTFKKQYPQITPKVTIKNSKRIIDQVLRHGLDLGIIEGEFSHQDIRLKPFTVDEMVLVVSPDHYLAKKGVVTVEDIVDELWVLREVGSGTREFIDREFKRIGFLPRNIMELGSSQTIKSAVESGLGISILSNWAVEREVELNYLVPLSINGHPFIRKFYYATHKSQYHTKATELFLEFLESNN